MWDEALDRYPTEVSKGNVWKDKDDDTKTRTIPGVEVTGWKMEEPVQDRN